MSTVVLFSWCLGSHEGETLCVLQPLTLLGDTISLKTPFPSYCLPPFTSDRDSLGIISQVCCRAALTFVSPEAFLIHLGEEAC